MPSANEEFEAVKRSLEAGMTLEGMIIAEGQKIRELSKNAYHPGLLDARLSFVAGLAHLQWVKSGKPGITSTSISDRLVLVATFVQGIPATEPLISEGQYAKATAVVKQDYEIVARLSEVRNGTSKQGQTPSAKAAPQGSQRFYGELNKVAHPSNEGLLATLLSGLATGDVRGVSAIPKFVQETACGLYELHVFTMGEVLREALLLFLEMYPDDTESAQPAVRLFLGATEAARTAGFIVGPPNH